jgi:hypothetical protein
MNRLTRPRFADALLVLVLLAMPGWALWRGRTRGPAAEVRVVHAGKLVGVYPLNKDRVFSVSCDHPDDVKIEINSGRVRVLESDCPKGICRHAGWISAPGRSIVCIPNRLVIELTGEPRGYDVEAY